MAEQRVSTELNQDVASLAIAILGGTGDQGRGLARRFAMAGNPVIIGSRSADRAAEAAAGLRPGQLADGDAPPAGLPGAEGRLPLEGGLPVSGMSNEDAARAADIVIVAVPWEGHGETLASLAPVLAGKIVIDCVNPLGFDARGAYPLPVPEGSATEQAAAVLPDSVVVGAFHHVSAVLLLDPEVAEVDLDVMVLGDDRQATDLVQALAARIPGARGVYAGRLRNCGQVEALTANLIAINRRYKAHAGLRITDV
jgi:8-hydroxy-5-deazaflavin:NADPH oxidoreductase